MHIASILVDGNLFNVTAPAGSFTAVVPAHRVHHCVFWSTTPATLHIAGVCLAATADTPACATFCSETTIFGRVVFSDGPLAHVECSVGATAMKHQADKRRDEMLASCTPPCDKPPRRSPSRKANTLTAQRIACARSRACFDMLAQCCPTIFTAFRTKEQRALHIVVRHPAESARTAAAPRRVPAAQLADSSLGVLFGAACAESREWRRCAVSFSTVMRFFQREKATFKWATPAARNQTVVSAIKCCAC